MILKMARLNDSLQKIMFYGATPIIFERAKAMRLNPTDAEKILWNILNKKQMLGLRFKFQHPISQFIADFYCHKIKLVIEVDGGIHIPIENKERDAGRTVELEKFGIEVIRFRNDEVINDIENVKKTIENKCRELLSHLTNASSGKNPQPHDGGYANY